MNRQDILDQIAALHAEWADKYGDDQVPYVEAHVNPHDGARTDYPLHHADRSAPPEIDDLFNAQVSELLAQL